MFFPIYVILIHILFILLIPFFLLNKKTRDGFLQRLGWLKNYTLDSTGSKQNIFRIWFHGASAGDLLAIKPMIEELRLLFPRLQIVVSTITNSGYEMGTKQLSQVDYIFYFPFDLPFAVNRVLETISPDIIIFEYTEIWPVLITYAHRRKIPLVLTNGRFSEKRISWYQKMFFLLGNVLQKFSYLLMRQTEEAERAFLLGANKNTVLITGNTKFDNVNIDVDVHRIDELKKAFSISDHDLIWVVGSSHEGEEKIILDTYTSLKQDFHHLRLLIAPRYLERISKISAMIQAHYSHSFQLRSFFQDQKKDILLLDTIGELSSAYHLANIVFVGGSFVKRGGQNILEPAAAQKPVLFGPHMENFRDAVDVLLGRGGIQVQNTEHLLKIMKELLSKPKAIKELGVLAQETVLQIRGASKRNALYIQELLTHSK